MVETVEQHGSIPSAREVNLSTWHALHEVLRQTAAMELEAMRHVALSVIDLEASAKWYVEVLGMVEVFREESPTRRAVVYRFANGAPAVGLVEHVRDAHPKFDPMTTGLDHLAFSVSSAAELARWAEWLTASGVEHSGAIEVPPGQILNFKDPDGIALSLFWDRA
jgi:glyoxylase I family protein